MERTRNGLIPLVVPALVVVMLAGLALLFLSVRWFGADARAGLQQRVVDTAASIARQLDASVQRQADATKALGTSPMVWLWVKFQGERLSLSNRSHAQWALDEVRNYSGLLPRITVFLASERTRTVYEGGAAVASLSGAGDANSWYAASLATEGVLVSDDPRALRTSMRVMDGHTLLGAISCVGDVAALAAGSLSAAAEEPGFSFVLTDGDGSVLLARGQAAASASTIFDMFRPGERSSVKAAMAAVARPGATSVGVFAGRSRRLLTAVTRTGAPGWLLFVSSDLPRAPAIRIVIVAAIAAAALALLAAALVSVGLARARRNEALVRGLERERDAAMGIARESGAAAERLRSAAAKLREQAAVLGAEAASGRTAGAEAAGLLAAAEESAAEIRAGVSARVGVLGELASRARDAAMKAREARATAEAAGRSAAAAEEELNRVITAGSAAAVSVESALKGVEAVVETAERARLIALNAALEASRSGGHGVRAADELRKLAEEASTRARALAASIEEARDGSRAVSRAAQDAGKAVHEATIQSSDSTLGFEVSWQRVDGMLTRLEAANAHAALLRDEAGLSDRGRSAVEGASRIMARIEERCAEIAALAAGMAAESEGARRTPGEAPKQAKEKAIS